MPDSGIMGCGASGHPLTAQIGTDMLRAGGGFMPLRKPHGSARLLDGFARMPHIDAHDSRHHDFKAMPIGFDHSVQTLHIGRASVALPGLMPLLRDERPALAPGSGGSNRLRGAILRMLPRHSMQAEATGDPRRGIGVAWA